MSIHQFLTIHIYAGIIGLLFGMLALMFKKGTHLHNKTGTVFFVAMTFMSLTGSYIAYERSVMLSLINGFFICYMMSTSWMSVRRPEGTIGKFDVLALAVVIMVISSLVYFGIKTMNGMTNIGGFPAPIYFIFASVALFAAIMDMKMLLQGGVRGSQRIARHLWRMCFPLFMATAAFFLGQAKLFPESIRKMELLAIPVVVVLLTMVFWLYRTLFSNWYRMRNSAPALNSNIS